MLRQPIGSLTANLGGSGSSSESNTIKTIDVGTEHIDGVLELSEKGNYVLFLDQIEEGMEIELRFGECKCENGRRIGRMALCSSAVINCVSMAAFSDFTDQKYQSIWVEKNEHYILEVEVTDLIVYITTNFEL